MPQISERELERCRCACTGSSPASRCTTFRQSTRQARAPG